ncbi:MAG: hypothetical protein ACRECD_00320 [Burkholderiaceae bacterium]
MITVFVLDVLEFLPLVDHARGVQAIAVSGPALGYYRLDAQGELTMVRKALGFKPAVWHGALTGGLIGRVAQFDNDTLTITEELSS